MSHITGSAGEPGAVPTAKRARRPVPVLPVLLLLVFLVGGGNLLASWQQVQSFKDQLHAQQVAEQKAAAKEIGELCATFGKVAELKPPAGNPQTNPSRAFDQEEHADLSGVVPDLGCDARAASRTGRLAMSSLTRPALFGVFDGVGCFLGVEFGLFGHPSLIVSAAVGVGAAEMVFMAGGEWLSESGNGLLPSLVIGVATGLGALIPALPYAIMPGWYARGWSAGLILALTALIAWQRRSMPRNGKPRGLRRAATESFGVLFAAAAVTAACVRFTPAGAS